MTGAVGQPLIGFIGQGYVGRNYADDFETRGHRVVRYALEEPYRANKEKIADCGIVFIGVPTPTTVAGFDDSIVREAIELVGVGKTAVIKSTIVPGTTMKLQEAYPGRIILFSPEFLSEATAAADAAHPFSNIIGLPVDDEAHQAAAEQVQALLPPASFSQVMGSTEAELTKYTHNASGYMQIVFFNLMYDLAQSLGVEWAPIEAAIKADPYICNRYAKPVHKSGRGAGGHCFIKDFAALRAAYEEATEDAPGVAVFTALEKKNAALLTDSGKSVDLLATVYGTQIEV